MNMFNNGEINPDDLMQDYENTSNLPNIVSDGGALGKLKEYEDTTDQALAYAVRSALEHAKELAEQNRKLHEENILLSQAAAIGGRYVKDSIQRSLFSDTGIIADADQKNNNLIEKALKKL